MSISELCDCAAGTVLHTGCVASAGAVFNREATAAARWAGVSVSGSDDLLTVDAGSDVEIPLCAIMAEMRLATNKAAAAFSALISCLICERIRGIGD